MHKEATTILLPSRATAFTPADIGTVYKTDNWGNRYTNTTATTYGNQIHLTRYYTPLKLNVFRTRTNYTKSIVSKRRANNINRAKRQVYRLVMCNFKQQPIRAYQNPVWCTFTYPDSQYAKITNRKSHIKDLNEYFRQLRQRYGSGIRYLAVMELTQKQNVHWHVLVFNLPKFESSKELAQIWIDINDGQGRKCSHGAQEIERIPWGYKNARKSAEDLAGYLSKYLTKTFDSLEFSHHKLYLPSKDLEQPVHYTNPEELDQILIEACRKFYFCTYTSQEYEVPYVGTIRIQVLEPET